MSHTNPKVSLFSVVCVWVAVIGLLALGCLVPLFLASEDEAQPPTFDPNPPARSGPSKTFLELPAVDQTPYRRGFDEGYYAFMAQVGKHSDTPRIVLKNAAIGQVSATTAAYTAGTPQDVYLTDTSDGNLADMSAYDAGYVDGYHKATEAVSCPRCEY